MVIEAQQSIDIDASIQQVWTHVQDIPRWASLFPGYRACQVIDARQSKWILKVGAGGLVRTVTVLVEVQQWLAPACVEFTFQLQGDPVSGSGAFVATAESASRTNIALTVQVQGSGALAPMWEAMSRPLLPTLARTFAQQLKAAIEQNQQVQG